ncbi:MAG: acylneuraminate cytidylyltransferase, partial [Bacteroidales bacterium]|nr:acylneuraminate cytidylyltransferase [Bacteroidales bacterium]
PLAGRPLVYWVLDAALGSKYIDYVYVSTDSQEIVGIIESYGQTLPLNKRARINCISRSAYTATDTASTESAMLEFAQNYRFDDIVLIQATNPLLTYQHLDEALMLYRSNRYDSMLSLVRQKRFLWKKTEDALVEPINYSPHGRPRRQEMDGFLVENGAFYIISKKDLLESKCRLSGNKIGFYEMPEESYYEIDEPDDWLVIEQIPLRRRKQSQNALQARMKKIKFVAMDCDGVLTDGGMYYSDDGAELKKFNTRDGMGISLLHDKGIKTAIITGENTEIVRRRAAKLKIDYVYLGIQDKLSIIRDIAKKENIELSEVAFIGDDLNDLDAMQNVGVSFSVRDGMDCVKSIADYVSRLKGGRGAVREIAEFIIAVGNEWG